MNKITGRITFLLVIAALLVSAVRALAEGPSATDQSGDYGPMPDPSYDVGSGGQALVSKDGIVHALGPGSAPAAGYDFSDPGQYRPVYVFTRSQGVRDLVAPQGLLGMTLNPGPLYALSDLGFLAWVPEPLIPVLEAHPEVERLEWDAMKMPLVLIQDYEIQAPVSDGSEA